MASLEKRLDTMERMIKMPGFRENKGLGNEVGYFVFDYSPDNELVVGIIYLLNKPRPVIAELLFRYLRINQCRHQHIGICFFTHSPGFIRIIAVIPDHLLSFIGNMGDQIRQPIHG